MFLTTARSALSIAGLPRAGSTAAVARPADVARPRARPRRLAVRGATHSLLADAQGVWAWSVDDAYARPARYETVQSWMEGNPGARLHLWLAADLIPESRAFDMETLGAYARRREIDLQAVAPWWRHALTEATRCVPALSHPGVAEVCVVEGRELNIISIQNGASRQVHHVTLESPTLAALKGAFDARCRARGGTPLLTVALGQGLLDGGRTDGLDAHVLGRLDGQQPPHWLRPTAKAMLV